MVSKDPNVNDGNVEDGDPHALAETARRHLWLHFSQMGSYSETHEIPIMSHGEGAYVWDTRGKKYLDGLSGLFTSQLGHGQIELAEAASEQAGKLAYFPLWTYAHPTAIQLAKKLASLAPGDLNRVFFTNSGSEAVESAWKLTRQYHKLNGDPHRTKVISRDIAYHGTTFGAMTVTSIEGMRTPFEPLVPGAIKVPNTNFYRATEYADDLEAFSNWAADEIERAILREGANTVAAVFLEPVQNSGGCFVAPPGYLERVRDICSRHGVLLVFDETITAFGRLGDWFGANRYGVTPDIITCAKGLTSAYLPMGAMIASDRLMEPFLSEGESFLHGLTFGGHPVSSAVALKNIEIMEREDILGHVNRMSPIFKEKLDRLSDLPIVGDIRGDGFFWAIELVKDKSTRESFNDQEANSLLRGYLSGALYEKGLMCRADDRGDPVIQLAPPLISTEVEIDFIVSTLGDVLEDALSRI